MSNEKAVPVAPLSAELSILAYIHCGKCVEDWKAGHAPGQTPAEFAQLSPGWTKEGLQIWCRRHNCNVVHIDFEGAKHRANTDTAVMS